MILREGCLLIPQDFGTARLITNPADNTIQGQNAVTDTREGMKSIVAYLDMVRAENVCPFVQFIEDANGYFLNNFFGDPRCVNFAWVMFQMDFALRCAKQEYFPEKKRGELVPITVVVGFSHSEACKSGFLTQLEKMKKAYRHPLMRDGIKFEFAHPLRPLGGSKIPDRREELQDKPLFRADIPLILMRFFHPSDRVFMRSEEDRKIYKAFFGFSISRQ